jgi:1,4-dihydroxy-2-naphthoyl-CoA synthase
MELRAHLDMASSNMAMLYSTEDHLEALEAFAEKRKGQFKGR